MPCTPKKEEDEAGNWTARKDVCFMRYKSGKGPLNNEWAPIETNMNVGEAMGQAMEAAVAPSRSPNSPLGLASRPWRNFAASSAAMMSWYPLKLHREAVPDALRTHAHERSCVGLALKVDTTACSPIPSAL